MSKPFFLATFLIIFLMLCGTAVYAFTGSVQNRSYNKQINLLQKQIETNKLNIENINSSIKYQDSDAFAEKIAREKLGYVMKDEIVYINK